ncbi:MAG TPA: cytochrome c peroxidase [Prosthecobacter sp.]
MKALPTFLLASLLATVCSAQLPDGTAISLENNIATSTSRVSITDPGNHVWTLQWSSNLVNWYDVESLKVHNGHLTRQMTHSPSTTQLFYRTSYSAAQQSALSSTTATALIFPGSPYDYTPTLPNSFLVNPISQQDNMTAANTTTDLGARLGRVLFYDKRLSINFTISCASCHQPEHGFSDPRQFSVGFAGGLTGRNSMGLTNARWYQRRSFFWDERAATLEDQVLLPIQNEVEMGMTLPALEARLNAEPYYTDLFNQTFGTSTITSTLIARALAQFVRSIISTGSRFDIAAAGGTPLTAQELQGQQIFNGAGNCNACHGTDNFVPGGGPPTNNGLENPYVDKGIGAISGRTQDEGLFKVGSLRNIELTAPYMHDGRFATLEQVVEFYNSGVVAHPNLAPQLRNGGPGGPPRRLNLTTAQKAALVAFMKTLTDTTVTSDAKFSDPFNYGD